jgi:hypothetical protein
MPLLHKPVQHKYPFVFATGDVATGTPDGLTVHLRRNQCWAADDPVVKAHEHDGLFSDDPPELIRSTPDVARQEAASALGRFVAEVAEADRNQSTSTLLPY